MRSLRYLSAAFLLLALAGASHATDFKVVVLDSKNGHALRGKLVCINLPPDDPNAPVVEHVRACQRTDSGGVAVFALTDPVPVTVDVSLASDGLMPCFTPHTFAVSDAMKTGTVSKNTCGGAATDTTETGEVVVFAHQKSLREAMSSVSNEF
ncbi:MAG TPA: hypothetical protein VMD98_11045 [Bryocella sp.]|nr:hypothetical protein [Bryocella sp.]